MSRQKRKKVFRGWKIINPKQLIVDVILFVIVIFGAFTMLVPYLWMLLTSFKTIPEAYALELVILPSSWETGSYNQLFSDTNFWRSIGNTLLIEIPVILIGTLVTSLAAFAFAKMRFRGKGPLLLILLSSMMIPYATVMLPQYRAFQSLGMVETLWPLILPGLFGNVSMMLFLIAFMSGSIPNQLIESAQIEGANFFQIFFRIGLPLSKPAIAAQVIFWFVGIWNDFLGPSIYLTNPNKQTLQVYLASLNSSYGSGTNLPLIMAGAVMASLPMIIIFLSMQNFFVDSISMSGIKE